MKKKGEKEEKKDNEEENKEKKKEKEYVLNDKNKFRKVVSNLKIIARASPTDKFLLVLGLKEIGSVVAVTGDGTNDAPALKCADVGFSMGIRGTDIAKEASKIILLNDSFDSIVTAVKYGRNVFDCLRKFLQFQLTVNVVACFMTLLGGIISKDSPLSVIQMLWVNLIMDSFASLALASESPNESLLKRAPYGRRDSFITKMMVFNVITQSIFQITVLTIIIFYGDVIFGVPSDRNLPHNVWNNINGYHFTIFFNIFVFMSVFNLINSTKLRREEKNVFEGIFDNYLFVLIQCIIIGGQILMVTFGGRALRTHSLTIFQHFCCIIIGSLTLVVGLIAKSLSSTFIEEEEEEIKGSLRNIASIRQSIRKGKAVKPFQSLKLK